MFLAPDNEHGDEINNLIGYCYGVGLRSSGLKFHAATAMSNHHHTDVTDVNGTLPAFKNWFHAMVARGVNAKRGRFDRFWSGDTPCDTRQPSDEETLEDLVYTLTNAVKAGLVKWGDRWPGFTTYGWRFGKVRTFKRPKWFFDQDGEELPEEVEVKLERPDIYPELSDDELYDLLMEKVREREREIQAEMKRKGRRFKGEKKVRRQHWNKAPTTPEERFTVTPKVAASKWARRAQLQRDREWEQTYAEARRKHATDPNTLFPPGTYWMRRFMGVKVATAPP